MSLSCIKKKEIHFLFLMCVSSVSRFFADANHAMLMLEARPQARSLARSPAGELEYRLPAAGGPRAGEIMIGEAEPWPLPPPTAD